MLNKKSDIEIRYIVAKMKNMTDAFSSIRHTLLGLWGMARPLVLVSNILAWLYGVSIGFGSGGPIDFTSLGFGFTAMLLISISVHYANEYADYQTDALTTRTAYLGGSGVLSRGIVPRTLALQAALATLILGISIQLLANYFGTHPWSAMALLGIGALGGWMYSLPPLKLAWRGWGELDNALLGANVLPVYGYTVLSGRFDFWVIVACLPFTLLAFNNLLAVTWPDSEADARVGKRTLATRWPIKQLRMLYGIVATTSFTLLLLLSGRILPIEVVIAGFTALPLTLWGAKTYTQNKISHAPVYAMVTMMITQTLAWFAIGIRF
ncbi:MAG: prenyltransferase [Candidatus Bathyarchaeota archaeon]|nr:prenyltransferase [Candidatus Bathyarchaeota archaeon]